jgi:hypothetical protein
LIKNSNLIFSCSYCNLAKSDKWISENENVNIINDEGFVDPCHDDYKDLFFRDSTGKIMPKSELAKYIHKELKLGLKIHSIFWTLERLYDNIVKLRAKKDKTDNENKILFSLSMAHFDLIDELREF